MNISAPSLPNLRHLPVYLSIDAATGLIYGTLSQINPLLTMSIFTIRGLADTLFYHLANRIMDGKDLYSHKIFIATTAAVNMTFLIVMRELNLIGRLFSCVLALSLVGYLVHRVRYIQDKESDDAILDLNDA